MVTRRKDPRQMRGGWQMDLFPGEVEPEPATAGRPARPAAASPTEDETLSPIGDSSADQEADR